MIVGVEKLRMLQSVVQKRIANSDNITECQLLPPSPIYR